jgi:PPOX class probable F420-dependent enzyme
MLHAFLARPNGAVITTLRPDGQPHAVPTWYAWRDGTILVNMEESRMRLRYMRLDPRVAISIFDPADWYTHVSILGRVTDIWEDENLVEIDRLSHQYRGTPYKTRDRRRFNAMVEPQRWFMHGEPESYGRT